MHTIRLTKSWERKPAGGYRRRFPWMARLEPNEQVWRIFEDVRSDADIFLNNRSLGQITPADDVARVSDPFAGHPRLGEPCYSGAENRILITDYLESTNELVLLPCASSTRLHELSQIVADVRLTISETSL